MMHLAVTWTPGNSSAPSSSWAGRPRRRSGARSTGRPGAPGRTPCAPWRARSSSRRRTSARCSRSSPPRSSTSRPSSSPAAGRSRSCGSAARQTKLGWSTAGPQAPCSSGPPSSPPCAAKRPSSGSGRRSRGCRSRSSSGRPSPDSSSRGISAAVRSRAQQTLAKNLAHETEYLLSRGRGAVADESIRERILQHCETSLWAIDGTGQYHNRADDYRARSRGRGRSAESPGAFLAEGTSASRGITTSCSHASSTSPSRSGSDRRPAICRR